MVTSLVRIVFSLAVTMLVTSSVAFAQMAEGQPGVQLVFGRGGSPVSTGSFLDITADLLAGYDTALPQFSQSESRRIAGEVVEGAAGLTYFRTGQRINFRSGYSGSVVHYPDFRRRSSQQTLTATSHLADVELGMGLGTHTNLTLSQTVGYSPFHHFRTLETTGGALDTLSVGSRDFFLVSRGAYSYISDIGVTHQLDSRTELATFYSGHFTDFPREPQLNWTTQGVGARASRQVAPNLALVAGYAFTRHQSQDQAVPFDRHDLDLGADYGRTLTVTRRTSFSFRTGSSMTTRRDQPPGVNGRETYLRVIGAADLNHRMGRTWQAHLGYERGFQSIVGIPEPFASDAVTAAVGGYLTDRLHFEMSSSYTQGGLRFSTEGRGYNVYDTSALLQFPISQQLALDLNYLYVRYLPQGGLVLPIPVEFERNAVRVGLSMWVPLLGR
ncbi:MAG TPA: hypothetical protein VH701_04085 [Vicinamibacterales bacterium]